MAGLLNWFHLIGSYKHYFAGITEHSSADPISVRCSARLVQLYLIYTPQETLKQMWKKMQMFKCRSLVLQITVHIMLFCDIKYI